MLTGIHFLLTYRCIFECDHCFVYSGPEAAERTFTLSEIRDILTDAQQIGTVTDVYFEGGEAFLVYPLLMEAIKLARGMGYRVGLVTNAYYATDEENAELFLRPLVDLGITDLSLSDDAFHHGEVEDNPARIARRVAERLGLPVGAICIEAPTVEMDLDKGSGKGAPIVGGDVMFRGRAVERLITDDLPRQDYRTFTACPYEELAAPGRVHLDPFGSVQICQGISMGNVFEKPLSQLIAEYRVEEHPIAGPLHAGGPVALAAAHGITPEEGYLDACHFCYLTRKQLLDRFPEQVFPRQVYGLNSSG